MSDDRAEQSYYLEMNKISLLKKEEEIELANRVAKGDKIARKKFIEANLRFVVSIAIPLSRGDRTLKKDLIQEGNIGLINAVERFNPKVGFKFSTFARWYIQGFMLNYLNKNNFLVLPQDHKTLVNKMLKLARECGIIDMYTHESVSRLTDEFNKKYPKGGGEKYTKDEISKIIDDYSLLFPICLDLPKFNDSDKTLSNYTEDVKSEDPQEITNEVVTQIKVKELICELSEVEQNIIIRRFGLDGREFDTLEEIGKSKGITRERIRQIEAKALRKLKNIMSHLHEEIK